MLLRSTLYVIDYNFRVYSINTLNDQFLLHALSILLTKRVLRVWEHFGNIAHRIVRKILPHGRFTCAWYFHKYLSKSDFAIVHETFLTRTKRYQFNKNII